MYGKMKSGMKKVKAAVKKAPSRAKSGAGKMVKKLGMFKKAK